MRLARDVFFSIFLIFVDSVHVLAYVPRIVTRPLSKSDSHFICRTSSRPLQYFDIRQHTTFGLGCLFLSIILSANVASADDAVIPTEPDLRDVQVVQMAFKDFDAKRFDAADQEFSIAIDKWRALNRPRDEIVSLFKARANVRLDNKQFKNALSDYDSAIDMMKTDGEKEDGTGRYPEYPDTFVGRALAHEGLAEWKAALTDYNKAISLWGGGRGENVNPFVLTVRKRQQIFIKIT